MRRIIEDAQRPVLPASTKPTPSKWSDANVTLCWLGHSTVLLNFYGIHVLTDPALGSRVGVSVGLGTAGPKRYVAPALRVEELPHIDLLLLSHAHRDHLDLPSLHKLSPATFTITAQETTDLLTGTHLKQIAELAWNEQSTLRTSKGELRIDAIEVKHWGQRWPSERPRGYNGYLLRREDKAILFAGDTAFTPLFSTYRSRGPFDLAIMPIGAYQPWIWNHCTPEQAVEMANYSGARFILPVHHKTFRLSDEPMNEPIERLEAALDRERERLTLRNVGETFIIPG